MTLETRRLLLRPWRAEDAESCYQYASDPEIGPRAGWLPHKSVAESREIIRDILSAEGSFAVCIREQGDTAVGCVGWRPTDALPGSGEPEIGYWIGRPFWGQGYIPEAAARLLHHLFAGEGRARVWCGHFAENANSRRVIAKLGFRPEFIRELYYSTLDQRRTEYFYAMTAAEFQNKYGETP